MRTEKDGIDKSGETRRFCAAIMDNRYLALDLGLRVVGVAWADGNLFAQGFTVNALHAFAMPSGKHRLYRRVYELLSAYRINVLVVGVPPPIVFVHQDSQASRNSRRVRKQILALAGRLKSYFYSQSLASEGEDSFSKEKHQQDGKSIEKESKKNHVSEMASKAVGDEQQKKIKVEIFDESFSTYAVKSEARFARWGAKNTGERGNPARKAIGNHKKSRANLDSLAAVEILTAFLNSEIGESRRKTE